MTSNLTVLYISNLQGRFWLLAKPLTGGGNELQLVKRKQIVAPFVHIAYFCSVMYRDEENILNEDKLKDSFQFLYKEYYDSLVGFAESYVNRRDIAEDIVQEIFVGLWEKELRFLSKAALNTYLYTSVKNAALDFLKHQEVENRYAEHFLSDSKESGRESKLDEEMLNLLFKSIDQLPERCREIFLMHLDGLSNEEIAVQLHLSVLTVKTQKKKAMKILRNYFSAPEHKGPLLYQMGWLYVLLAVN